MSRERRRLAESNQIKSMRSHRGLTSDEISNEDDFERWDSGCDKVKDGFTSLHIMAAESALLLYDLFILKENKSSGLFT